MDNCRRHGSLKIAEQGHIGHIGKYEQQGWGEKSPVQSVQEHHGEPLWTSLQHIDEGRNRLSGSALYLAYSTEVNSLLAEEDFPGGCRLCFRWLLFLALIQHKSISIDG